MTAALLTIWMLSQAAPPPVPSAHDLYAEARAAVAALPAELAPIELAQLARQEISQDRDDGVADFSAAFRQAVALPLSADDAAARRYRLAVKTLIEPAAVSALTRAGEFDAALALARGADVERRLVYAALLPAAPASADVAALGRECYHADGSYPYSVAMVLADTRSGIAPEIRRQLVHDAYRYAANTSSADDLFDAAQMLIAGQRTDPALVGEFEYAAHAVLLHMRDLRATAALNPADAHMLAVYAWNLLTLLDRLEPEHKTDLDAEFSMFAARSNPRYDDFDPGAAPAPLAGDPLQGSDGDQAALNAFSDADLADPDAVPADSAWADCLAAVESRAEAIDHALQAADPELALQIEGHFLATFGDNLGFVPVNIARQVATAAPIQSSMWARQSNSVALKPLLLLAVAAALPTPTAPSPGG